MLRKLRAWFGRGEKSMLDRTFTVHGGPIPPASVVTEYGVPSLDMQTCLAQHEGYPMFDEAALARWLMLVPEGEARDRARRAAEEAWLDHLRASLGIGFRVIAARDVAVVSSLDDREVAAVTAFIRRTAQRIAKVLGEIAQPARERHVLVVFDDLDAYYRYVSWFYPEGGEYALSGGMFLGGACPHFVTTQRVVHAIEPVIVHEMSHAAVESLALPSWLDEGLAVNVERRLMPAERALHTPLELNAMHRRYWNVSTIEAFWNGDVFHQPGEGVALAYDLARIVVEQLSRDWSSFERFVRDADPDDAGAAAARAQLGVDLGEVICALLGRNYQREWSPWTRRTVHAFELHGAEPGASAATASAILAPPPIRAELAGAGNGDFSSLVRPPAGGSD